MRSFLLLVSCGLIVFFFAGCKKEGNNENGRSLVGLWELRYFHGGMSPNISFPAGNGQMIRFDETRFEHLNRGQVVMQGRYHLQRDSIIDVNSCALLPPKDELPNRIVYDNDINGVKQFFELSGNTLKISVGCIPLDGGVSTYKRIGDGDKSEYLPVISK